MDKKKTITLRSLAVGCMLMLSVMPIWAQLVSKVEFCGNDYDYIPGKDSITLYLKFLNGKEHVKNVTEDDLKSSLVIKEDGKGIHSKDIKLVPNGGISPEYTFSVLVDQKISTHEMNGIYDAVKRLVEAAPDSCVYLSFFGDRVTESKMINKNNYDSFRSRFSESTNYSYFYDGVYAKMVEFSYDRQDYEGKVKTVEGYSKNTDIAKRAEKNPDKNILFIFLQGAEDVGEEIEDDGLDFRDIVNYQTTADIMPIIYAFYYTGYSSINDQVGDLLTAITTPRRNGQEIEELKGKYLPSDNEDRIIREFNQAVEDAKYDYAFTYKVSPDALYSGNKKFTAFWENRRVGEAEYSIGTIENPWPLRSETTGGFLLILLWALLVTLLMIAIFFCIMKIIVPAIKSKFFAAKHYNVYKPEANINKRVCYYCKQPIEPGQKVVTKCKHITHVHCWKLYGYHCAEYGQNCSTGIQEHVEWSTLLTRASFRDCHQAIAGIVAAFVAWLIYELTGRGMFTSFANSIAGLFLDTEEKRNALLGVTTTKLSAFFAIGLLLAFFLSLVFRYNDEYRNKSWQVFLKILGLSLFSALIGFAAFLIGGVILCMIVSSIKGVADIPWYCSLPAYLLFSVCTSLGLTVKSSIPVKSAMIGGLCSAVIGFLVLYFASSLTSDPRFYMLLNFIIYGGGLGASLVTVRMLAEKYFLVIMNGARQGTRIPIHKWMSATGGGQKVAIGMAGDCEIQMNWDKSNRVAKQHAQLYIDQTRTVPVIKPLDTGVNYNSRAELPVQKTAVLTNGDTFQIGDTIFRYEEND